ncbi:MAG TPA: carboxypeptidase-like regulatory domain-containing protein, partial [Labilithrix sp.]
MLRARNVLLVLLCLLYVASWPGATVRPLYVELTAPPLPKEIAERDGVLDVVVHAAEGDKPALAGARVRAFAMLDGRAHAAGDATTDRQGLARLERLPRAEHWIVAESPGRARASQMVVIVPGARRLDLELGPEHVLDVEVKTEQGAPIPAAEIEARGADPFPVGARTGDDGRARVGRLADGPWTVRVRATGYEEVVRRRVTEGAPLVVVLGKQGALVVKVESANGEPASGAHVLVASPQLWPARVAETGADGTVRIGGLDRGAYALRATKGNDVSPIEVGVAIEKGEEKNVELRLAPGVVIAAHVVDGATEDDVKDARVTLTESGLSSFPIEAVTDKHGRAALGPIAPGEATLSARAEGYV